MQNHCGDPARFEGPSAPDGLMHRVEHEYYPGYLNDWLSAKIGRCSQSTDRSALRTGDWHMRTSLERLHRAYARCVMRAPGQDKASGAVQPCPQAALPRALRLMRTQIAMQAFSAQRVICDAQPARGASKRAGRNLLMAHPESASSRGGMTPALVGGLTHIGCSCQTCGSRAAAAGAWAASADVRRRSQAGTTALRAAAVAAAAAAESDVDEVRSLPCKCILFLQAAPRELLKTRRSLSILQPCSLSRLVRCPAASLRHSSSACPPAQIVHRRHAFLTQLSLRHAPQAEGARRVPRHAQVGR